MNKSSKIINQRPKNALVNIEFELSIFMYLSSNFITFKSFKSIHLAIFFIFFFVFQVNFGESAEKFSSHDYNIKSLIVSSCHKTLVYALRYYSLDLISSNYSWVIRMKITHLFDWIIERNNIHEWLIANNICFR